jgi:hypothetical protein
VWYIFYCLLKLVLGQNAGMNFGSHNSEKWHNLHIRRHYNFFHNWPVLALIFLIAFCQRQITNYIVTIILIPYSDDPSKFSLLNIRLGSTLGNLIYGLKLLQIPIYQPVWLPQVIIFSDWLFSIHSHKAKDKNTCVSFNILEKKME